MDRQMGVVVKHDLFLCMAVISFFLLSGCTGQAKRDVRQLVAKEMHVTEFSEARYKNKLAEKYLGMMADTIREAAIRLDTDPEHVDKRDSVLDVYDIFIVYIVHDPIPNAWVVGDDFMCITTAAILQAEHPEEIAFIMAHEFGHLRAEHAVEMFERKYANRIAAGVVAGLGGMAAGYQASNNPYYTQSQYARDMNNAVRAAESIMASFSPHKKADEFEADLYAIELMDEAGYGLSYATKFFERSIELYGDVPSDSHPLSSDRLRRLEELIAEHSSTKSKRRFNLDQFTQIQDQIRATTVQELDSDSLSFFSVLRASDPELRESPIKSCGPVDADMDTVVENYTNLILDLN